MSTSTLITLVVIAVVLVLFVLPLRMSWRSKGIIALIALIAPSKSYLYLVVGGDAFDPHIPYNLTFILDLARTTAIFLALLVLLRLIINVGYRLLHLNWHCELFPTSSLFHAQLMVIASLLLACYGTSCAYSTPELKRYEFTLERLDPRLEGMKIIMLSDLHISTPTDASYIYQLVERVNASKPDLILLNGDIVDGTLAQRRPLTDLLFALKAKYGVFITSGNHEYYSNYPKWRQYFEQGGFISLDNKVVALQDQAGKLLLNLGGLTDPRAARYNLPTPDVTGVVQALDDRAPSLIMSHRPQYAVDLALTAHQINAQRAQAAQKIAAQNAAVHPAAPQANAPADAPTEAKADVQAAETKAPATNFIPKHVDLVLSGHTHGGLAYGWRELIAQANGGFVSGHYQLNHTHLVVGNGIMVWMGFPLRLGVPNQIVELTLHSKLPQGKMPLPLSARLTAAAELKYEAAQQARAAQKAKAQQDASKPAAAARAQLTMPAAQESVNPAAAPLSPEHIIAPHSDDGIIDSFSLAQSDEIKPSGSVLHIPRELSNLELILPMVDAETGAVSSAITKLAVLPERISHDQLRRINAILAEDPTRAAQPAQQEASSDEQESLSTDPKSGVSVIVLKDAPLKTQPTQQNTKQAAPQAAANKPAAQGQAPAQPTAQPATNQKAPAPQSAAPHPTEPEPAEPAPTEPAPAERGQLHLTAVAPNAAPQESPVSARAVNAAQGAVSAADVSAALSPEEQADHMTALEDNALYNLGPVSAATSYTLELQTEYAISLDPNNQARSDSTVSDLLSTPDKDNNEDANEGANPGTESAAAP